MTDLNIKLIERRIPEINVGVARIGKVSVLDENLLYYKGRHFEAFDHPVLKTNYRCLETEEFYLITSCDPEGNDVRIREGASIIIDEDIRNEYWKYIRNEPQKASESLSKA